MPKGHVPEREVICKACTTPFLSTRVGRAAFYCRQPQCDEERRRSGFRVKGLSAESRERLLAEARAAREAKRKAARDARERAKRVERAKRAAARLEPRAVAALSELVRLARELHAAQDMAGVPRTPLLPSGAADREVIVQRAPFEDEQLLAVREALIARPRGKEAGRQPLQRAVVRLANARGLEATRAALLHLAVEALAWELRLPARTQMVRGVDDADAA